VTDHDFAPSAVLSERYEIERLLGRGGMATVYLARDLKHDRRVAIKVVSGDLSHHLGADRFLREIDIAGKLTHPHILPLHDSGESDGVLYYVMPYVEGETLRERLRREHQLPLADAVRTTCEIASALDYAHRHDVLHRDIKPENILLKDGHAVLADFGIARAIDAAADTGMTATGLTLGTPVYMSPEQSSGGALDGRSDLYSLACVLYEMLAGEPPFTGPTAQAVIAKRLSGMPPRIRTLRPSVPDALEQVLLRALDRTPADRFATAGQFRDALAACTGSQERRAASRARRPVVAGVGAVMLVTALAAGWSLTERTEALQVTSVAVLPFESSHPEHTYLAEGLADALIGDLVSAVPAIRVVSRMSAMRYSSTTAAAMAGMSGGLSFMSAPAPSGSAGAMAPKSPAEIARELRVDALLQGTVDRDGDTIRVQVALVRPDPVQTIWEYQATRHLRDLFALQRDLAGAIANAVTRRGAGPGHASGPVRAHDPAAHEAFLKGSYYQALWRLPQAIESFELAVRLDASHAAAHASLARAYYFQGFFGDIPPSIALAGMRRAATAALQHDNEMADAHAQLALVKMLQDWDWAGAEQHFRLALELSPGHAQIRHDYAHFLLGQGRQRESLEQTREAVALDPVNPMLISCLGWHSLFDARFDEAIRFAAEAHAMMPDHWAQIVLGWGRLGLGDPGAALPAFRRAVQLKDSAFTQASLGHALAVSGQMAEARRTLEALLTRMEHEYVSPYDIATVHAGMGDRDGAFKWLRRAADERSPFIVHVGWDHRFDLVRDDPRFADLVAREMRLPAPQFALSRAVERRGM
jgi:eukaryotic-like serine/threonine-protein kinase